MFLWVTDRSARLASELVVWKQSLIASIYNFILNLIIIILILNIDQYFIVIVIAII